jgi:hypothetical protein
LVSGPVALLAKLPVALVGLVPGADWRRLIEPRPVPDRWNEKGVSCPASWSELNVPCPAGNASWVSVDVTVSSKTHTVVPLIYHRHGRFLIVGHCVEARNIRKSMYTSFKNAIAS